MIDYGFYPFWYNLRAGTKRIKPPKPANLGEIIHALAQPRPSSSTLQCNEDDFAQFVERSEDAISEMDIMVGVLPTLINIYGGQHNVTFNNMEAITPGMKQVRVDFYSGAPPTSLRRGIRDQLRNYILPSTSAKVPIVPNFFIETKGPDGSGRVVKNQALHAGAIGARAVQQLRELAYPNQPLDGNAYIISCTFSGGLGTAELTLYTVHPVASSDPTRAYDYCTTRLKDFNMVTDAETFKNGAIALQNAQDWAEKQREVLVAAANAQYDDTG